MIPHTFIDCAVTNVRDVGSLGSKDPAGPAATGPAVELSVHSGTR